VTLLDREIVDAVSIAAATAAILVAGRREERSSYMPGQTLGRSRLATASALGLVALLAAVGVVAVSGSLRARRTTSAPLPVAARVIPQADIRLPTAAPIPFACMSPVGSSRTTRTSSTLPRRTRCRGLRNAAAASSDASAQCAFASGLCG